MKVKVEHCVRCCSGRRRIRVGRQTASTLSSTSSWTSTTEWHRIAAGLSQRPALPGPPPAPLRLRAVQPRSAASASTDPGQPLRHERGEAFPCSEEGARRRRTSSAGRQGPLRWTTGRRPASDQLERCRRIQPVRSPYYVLMPIRLA